MTSNPPAAQQNPGDRSRRSRGMADYQGVDVSTSTTRPTGTAEAPALPVDIETMRVTVRRLLEPDDSPDALPLAADELETLTLSLRGHVQLLIPEVEQAAAREDSIPAACAFIAVSEARRKLCIEPYPGLDSAIAYARRLARSVNALCDHYENLGGSR